MPTLAQLRARRDEILAVAEQNGAFNVRVFGSVARGEATAKSDVDLLVSMREGASMFDVIGLWLDLQEMLGCEVSLITDDEHPRKERFMQRVRKDAVPL
ncbi:MAG: nucleotidyltransferase [Anaerolineaceae bacterium]|nr:MAG: nucleotidyltransferase [Anaerolineaceae bacterium]